MRELQPIKSRADYGPGEGPAMFGPSNSGELGGLSGQFFFHHHDLCRFHMAVVRVTNERLDDLKKFVDENRETIEAQVDFESYDAVIQSRVREYARSWEIEIDNVQGYGDQLFAVGLWAMAEQYLTRTLEVAVRSKKLTTPVPYKWSELRREFHKLGVNVEGCSGFADANECRILNNKAKHLGIVDEELARFPAFVGLQGRQLTRVPLDLQRYSNGIFEFVGSAMEEADRGLSPSVG